MSSFRIHAKWMSAVVACAMGTAMASVLTVCTEAPPEGFDIAQYEASVTKDAAGLTIYDQLLQFKPGETEITAGLAQSWKVSADGMRYTLYLRKEVPFGETAYFKPTRFLNADDVLFSLNRMYQKTHPWHKVAKNGYPYWDSMGMRKLIHSIEKLDPYTVQITLNRPEAPFLANLALPQVGSVFSKEYADQLEKMGRRQDINTHPVGSGPFIFKNYQKMPRCGLQPINCIGVGSKSRPFNFIQHGRPECPSPTG